MKNTALHYIVTPGECFNKRSHTPKGFAELARLLMFFQVLTPIPQIVMGQENRFREIFRFFLEAKVIAQDYIAWEFPYCDGIDDPSLDTDPWVFIRGYSEKTLFLADPKLVAKLGFQGELPQRAECFVLSHERRAIIQWL